MKIFNLADQLSEFHKPICSNKILFSMFLEPSTRTRFSFESSMIRLGGNCIGFADPRISSIVKGESLSDTAKIISNYCDIVVLRHKIEGLPKLFAQYSSIPIINAGDGVHEHPSQALIALYTVFKKKKLTNLKVGLYGDLKFGRTVHSLAPLLARFNVQIILISPPELRLPFYTIKKIEELYNGQIIETTSLNNVIKELDVLYITRLQSERFTDKIKYKRFRIKYDIPLEVLQLGREDLLVMHPLPRITEIPKEFDKDQRAIYFEQASNSIKIRKALLAILTKSIEFSWLNRHSANPLKKFEFIEENPKCLNPNCIVSIEESINPLKYTLPSIPLTLCGYCEQHIANKII